MFISSVQRKYKSKATNVKRAEVEIYISDQWLERKRKQLFNILSAGLLSKFT